MASAASEIKADYTPEIKGEELPRNVTREERSDVINYLLRRTSWVVIAVNLGFAVGVTAALVLRVTLSLIPK